MLRVEGEELVRQLAARILRQAGYTVLETGSGKEALRTLRGHAKRIHLLLTDVVMHDMCGDELAEAVRRIAPDMRVLLMPGHTSDVMLRRCIR